jgi:hypothetical protein
LLEHFGQVIRCNSGAGLKKLNTLPNQD